MHAWLAIGNPGKTPTAETIRQEGTPLPLKIKKMSGFRGALLHQIRSFFEHCSKSLLPPPPLRFEHHVANFFDGFLKKRVNVCRDKIRQSNA